MHPLLLLSLLSMQEDKASVQPPLSISQNDNEKSMPEAPVSESDMPIKDNVSPAMANRETAEDLTSYDELLQQQVNEIITLKETIQNISAQYEELMEVAERYKEEATKWHYLYLNR